MKLHNRPHSRIGVILISLGLLLVVWSLITSARIVLSQRVPPDVTVVTSLPSEPPETLPDFAVAEAVTPSVPAAPTPVPRPSSTGEAAERVPRTTQTPPPEPAQSPPTRIIATSIGLDSPIVPVAWRIEDTAQGPRTVWEVASNAAGWHVNSEYPGNGGNVVLSGHNNIEGEVFRDLIDLQEGDTVRLFVGDIVYPYEVVGKMLLEEEGMPIEVRRSNGEWIAPTDYERLTLVSCWPYSTYTHRLIVVAAPVK